MALTFEEAILVLRKISLTMDADECEHSKEGVEPGYSLKTCDDCKGSGQQMG